MFIGFVPDKFKLRGGHTLNLAYIVTAFLDSTKNNFNRSKLAPGEDVSIHHCKWTDLPSNILEAIGGKEAAEARRKQRIQVRDLLMLHFNLRRFTLDYSK